jgi:hypothetical protein
MSSRVNKLEALLARVRERRDAPRLRSVAAAPLHVPTAVEKPLERAAAPITERLARPAAPTPLEDAMSELSPRPMAPTPVPSVRTPQPPASAEISLDDFEPVRPSRTPEKKRVEPAPPVAKAPPPPVEDLFGDPFASRPPPAAPTPVAVPAPAPAPVPMPVAAPPAPVPVAQPAPAPVPAPVAQPVQLSAPSARVAAEAPVASAPVAKAVSPVRTEAPNTFGELLERTLSLRPR